MKLPSLYRMYQCAAVVFVIWITASIFLDGLAVVATAYLIAAIVYFYMAWEVNAATLFVANQKSRIPVAKTIRLIAYIVNVVACAVDVILVDFTRKPFVTAIMASLFVLGFTGFGLFLEYREFTR